MAPWSFTVHSVTLHVRRHGRNASCICGASTKRFQPPTVHSENRLPRTRQCTCPSWPFVQFLFDLPNRSAIGSVTDFGGNNPKLWAGQLLPLGCLFAGEALHPHAVAFSVYNGLFPGLRSSRPPEPNVSQPHPRLPLSSHIMTTVSL